MDRFEIEPTPGGGATVVDGRKPLPRRAAPLDRRGPRPDRRRAGRGTRPRAPSRRSSSRTRSCSGPWTNSATARPRLAQLNRELEETNRGVVALYAELDEKADSLRRASELKTRFLSNMSHEFRTPAELDPAACRGSCSTAADGELTAEQEKQVRFIRKAAEGLSELVNDLLDLAKVEAGKAVVRARGVRGRRPVRRPAGDAPAARSTAGSPVALVFEEPAGVPTLHDRRGQGRADPAELPLQRPEVHRARRGPRLGDGRARATRSSSRWPTPASASRRRTSERDLRGVRPGRRARPAAGQGDRPGPAAVAEAGRAARRAASRSGSKPGVGSTFTAIDPAGLSGPAEA